MNIVEKSYQQPTVGNSSFQTSGIGFISKADCPKYAFLPRYKPLNEQRPSRASISSRAIAISHVTVPDVHGCGRFAINNVRAMDVDQAHRIIQETAGIMARIFPVLQNVTAEDIDRALDSPENYEDE